MIGNANRCDIGVDLGPRIVEYYPSRGLGYVGVSLLVFIVTFLVLTYLEIGPFTLLLPILLAVFLVPIGVVLLLELTKSPYVLRQGGFAVYRRGKWSTYTWRDLTAIWLTTKHTYHEITHSVTQHHSCQVMFQDGMRLKLDHLSEELIRWIAQEAYPSILPKVQAEWNSGQPVRFGAVCLSKAGIHFGKRLLRWREVASVNPERNESNIVIRQKGRHSAWTELDGEAIPNFPLFLQLARENIGQ